MIVSDHSLPDQPNSLRGSVSGWAEDLIRGTPPRGWNARLPRPQRPMRRSRLGRDHRRPHVGELQDCTSLQCRVNLPRQARRARSL